MLEKRTMIGGGVIGPNDTEFMGYPIVNSVEGPLDYITASNCTEGCITRCIVFHKFARDKNVHACTIQYILLLNNIMYLIDSSCQIVTDNDNLSSHDSKLLMPQIVDDGIIANGDCQFPNKIQY